MKTWAIWRSPEQLERAKKVLDRGVCGLWTKMLQTQVGRGFATGLVLMKAEKESLEESSGDLKEAV
jgi:hypothetical protein